MKNNNMIIDERAIDQMVHRQMRRQELCGDSRYCTKVIEDKRKRKPKYKKNCFEE